MEMPPIILYSAAAVEHSLSDVARSVLRNRSSTCSLSDVARSVLRSRNSTRRHVALMISNSLPICARSQKYGTAF
jgi:hypothetical protein